jgi:hypothetical protein
VSSSAGKLYEVGLEEGAAVRELQAKVDGLLAVLAKYVGPTPGLGSEVQMGPNHQGERAITWWFPHETQVILK